MNKRAEDTGIRVPRTVSWGNLGVLATIIGSIVGATSWATAHYDSIQNHMAIQDIRMDHLDNRMDRLDSQLESLDSKIDKIGQTLASLGKRGDLGLAPAVQVTQGDAK